MEGDVFLVLTPYIQIISIHALRVEGDSLFKVLAVGVVEFLSTPSGWRATHVVAACTDVYGFLSTPSGWRATFGVERNIVKVRISIHALRVEGDQGQFIGTQGQTDFYPRPPGGGRLCVVVALQ